MGVFHTFKIVQMVPNRVTHHICSLLWHQEVTFYGSSMYHRRTLPEIFSEVKIDGLNEPALVHRNGMLLTGSDGQKVGQFDI